LKVENSREFPREFENCGIKINAYDENAHVQRHGDGMYDVFIDLLIYYAHWQQHNTGYT